jgi:hypothetical protein
MRFFFPRIGALFAAASFVWITSCEKHHVGELPHHQHGHETEAHGSSPSPVPTEAAHDQKAHGDSGAATSPAAVSPTPVEFFPQNTPR